ncbi:hypothetical protein [Nocardia sp. NPDC057030]|uniref:hypothetical protein n=1 Tax=Nocardia sp. NPDC057030 TaxID=3346005 RepID=UPI00363E3028
MDTHPGCSSRLEFSPRSTTDISDSASVYRTKTDQTARHQMKNERENMIAPLLTAVVTALTSGLTSVVTALLGG